MITAERLRELASYNPDDGVLTWRSGPRAGSRIGSISSRRYLCCRIENKHYQVHRLIWLYVHGKWPDGDIDHANRVKTDNRIDNLRDCTRSQNNANKARFSTNKSGVKGVYWSKWHQKWIAQISVNNKDKKLGVFTSIEEASAAYMNASKQIYGEFSCAKT